MRELLLVLPLCLGLSAPIEEPPSRVAEPEIPAELAARGIVYHTIHGREAQVTFTSRAPLENIVGKSNQVVGYAVAGPGTNPAALAGGRWILPVRSLATGLPLRDEHMIGEGWLDADRHPVIEFTLGRVEEIVPVKEGDGFRTYDATLVGTMTMHGVAREKTIPKARISFLKASERTASIAPGDLMFLRCAYSVSLADFGIEHPDVPGKVSGLIELDETLQLSTVAVPAPADRPAR